MPLMAAITPEIMKTTNLMRSTLMPD